MTSDDLGQELERRSDQQGREQYARGSHLMETNMRAQVADSWRECLGEG
jgi:hypothetical protein